MSGIVSDISSEKNVKYYLFVVFIALCIGGTLWQDSLIYLGIPVAILLVLGVLDNYVRLFYLIFCVLPYSVELYFDHIGIGTDFPSEPMMIFLTIGTFFSLIYTRFALPYFYLRNPITIFIFLQIFWIGMVTINSTTPLISLKFLLAKIWYVIPFFILPMLIEKSHTDPLKPYKILYKFLFISILIVLIRHAYEGFSFAASYDVVRPFFRNHVTYASISVICLPFLWAFWRNQKMQGKNTTFLSFALFIYLLGIYFSYTRAAILAVIFSVVAYYILIHQKIKLTISILAVTCTIMVVYLSIDNKYLDFAPNYERTITHYEFDNLIEATYKLEDISSMERVYRWLAGIEMIKSKFFLGFGPGSFYSNYQFYSISSFKTYVSDNPEKSGIHNYFLMIWVEQGFVGFLIWIGLVALLLVFGEKAFIQTHDPIDKNFIVAITVSTIIILTMSLINDLIETDKVGPFFYLNAYLILYYLKKSELNNIYKKRNP